VIAKIISHNNLLTKVLGKGTSPISIISSAIIVFISFFYVFTVGSFFNVPIYFLHNRLVSKLYFTDYYIINKYIDHTLIIFGTVLWLLFSVKGRTRFVAAIVYCGAGLIGLTTNTLMLSDIVAVLSIPIVICFLLYDRLSSNRILNTDTSLNLSYFSIICIAIGIVAIISSSALPFFSILSAPLPNYAYAIFVLFSSFSPVLMILLINAIPIKVLTKEITKGVSSKLKQVRAADLPVIAPGKIRLRNKVIYLSLIVSLTLVLMYIPHLPTINKENKLIGADSHVYANNWTAPLMKSNNLQEFIQNAFVKIQGGDRPITLIFLLTAIKLSPSEPSYTIDHIPLILGPVLVLVIYFLTREITSNDTVSLFASFLTAISFHTLVGLYAGYYANWFAIIIGYISFVFMFRFLKSSKKLNLFVYFFLTILVLFSHTYTWTVLTTVSGIFLLVMLAFNYYSKISIIFLLVALLGSVVIDVAKISITGHSGGIERDVAIAREYNLGAGQLPVRWNNLIDTTEIYYGAAFGNFIILALGLYWLYRSDMRDISSIFLLIFLSIGIFPLFFGNWLIQSRVWYNIPFQIPAAMGLFYIKRVKYGSMMVLPICIWLISMAIRSVSNF
jgi:hypothetical protein